MRLEMVSASDEDVPELDLIGWVRKGGNKIGFVKGYKKKEVSSSSNQQKNNLSHIKCKKHGQYASQYLEK